MHHAISSAILSAATPAEAAALLRLQLLEAAEIRTLCERWLMEDLDRAVPEIAWLAAEPDIRREEAITAFEAILRALGVPQPRLEDAARNAVRLYVRAIADGRVDTFDGMTAVRVDLDNQFEDKTPMIAVPDRDPADKTRYVGETLGLSRLFTWYRELQDAKDGGLLFYFNDLPREAQLSRFEDELRREAAVLADQLERR